MSSTLEDFMLDQNIETVAHLSANSFSELIGRDLSEDEMDFCFLTTRNVLNNFSVISDTKIAVVAQEDKEKLKHLMKSYVDNLSSLMVQFVLSRMEAYVLYKQVKELEEKDDE